MEENKSNSTLTKEELQKKIQLLKQHFQERNGMFKFAKKEQNIEHKGK